MISPLRSHELGDGGPRGGIRRRDDHTTTSRKIFVAVSDDTPFSSHDVGARHVALMNKSRGAEISGFERALNESHVRSYLRDAKRIV